MDGLYLWTHILVQIRVVDVHQRKQFVKPKMNLRKTLQRLKVELVNLELATATFNLRDKSYVHVASISMFLTDVY